MSGYEAYLIPLSQLRGVGLSCAAQIQLDRTRSSAHEMYTTTITMKLLQRANANNRVENISPTNSSGKYTPRWPSRLSWYQINSGELLCKTNFWLTPCSPGLDRPGRIRVHVVRFQVLPILLKYRLLSCKLVYWLRYHRQPKSCWKDTEADSYISTVLNSLHGTDNNSSPNIRHWYVSSIVKYKLINVSCSWSFSYSTIVGFQFRNCPTGIVIIK